MPGKNIISRRLPAPRDSSIIVEENQDVHDIIGLMTYMHKRNRDSYDKIASLFLGNDIRETCENIFNFCRDNIPYEIETEDLQTVKTPQRILSDAELGYGHDCKHYASFIAGVLDALRRRGEKITWCFRFASYKLLDTTPGHVFVVVKTKGGEIWIDPVLDYFDERKKYNYSIDKSVMSGIGSCECEPEAFAMGSVIGADNSTAATLKSIGGTICAVAPTVAAVIPVGTVVAACMEIVGFATSFLGTLFKSKYAYNTNVDWLCQKYQFKVLGDANAKGNHITTGLQEKYVPAAQMWFAAVLGIPCWDQVRFWALKTNLPNYHPYRQDRTIAEKVADYRAFGAIESAVPTSAIEAACRIADTMDDSAPAGAWKNFPPANIVLQKQGLTAEQVVEQAAGVLTGRDPGSAPVSTAYAFIGSPYIIPIIIAGAAVTLIIINKKNR